MCGAAPRPLSFLPCQCCVSGLKLYPLIDGNVNPQVSSERAHLSLPSRCVSTRRKSFVIFRYSFQVRADFETL